METVIGSFATKGNMGKWFSIAAINGQPESSLNATAVLQRIFGECKSARAIKTVFYALDVVNQGMQEKQSITVRCMDIEDLEKQAEAIG